MHDYRKLEIWKRSHGLTLRLYEVTNDFPKGEVHGLTSHIRRSSISIPASIAEGCGRNSTVEFVKSLSIAIAATQELDYLLLLADELHYLSSDEYSAIQSELTHLHKMINNVIKINKQSSKKKNYSSPIEIST